MAILIDTVHAALISIKSSPVIAWRAVDLDQTPGDAGVLRWLLQ
jgi:hypothetical protein